MGAIMFDRAGNTNSETTISVSMMTKADCCAEAQVSLSFINKVISAGDLPCVRFGRAVRIRRSDWTLFVETSMRRGG